jgi:hypothetical protein
VIQRLEVSKGTAYPLVSLKSVMDGWGTSWPETHDKASNNDSTMTTRIIQRKAGQFPEMCHEIEKAA